jgi:hypothetical protein
LLQEQELLQYAAFLPGGAGVVFVQNNDLYHLDSLPEGKVTRITSSGIAGTLYNGVADWLYEGKQKRLNVVRVLLNNGAFCNGCITKRILLFHSQENKNYADYDKKYYIFLNLIFYHREIVKLNHFMTRSLSYANTIL